jgi:Flp pilus assembly protein TadG
VLRKARQTGDRGAIAILMAVCLMTFMGFAALAVDLTYVRYARLQLQNATDAASHAALVRLRATGSTSQARSMAISVAAQNRVWGKTFVLQNQDITFGGWDFANKTFTANVSPPNAVQVNGTRSALAGANGAINLTFGRVLGNNSVNLAHNGTTAYRIRSIVIAQDITGSFWSNIDPAWQADVTMLDALYAFRIPADRIGMQLFTGDGTQFTALTNLQSGYNTVHGQWQGDGKLFRDTTKTSGISLCNKLDINPYDDIAFRHAWMPACSTGGDGTNQGAAIQRATTQLLAQSQPYETRVIVLITDGNAECCTRSGTTVTCDSTSACSLNRAQYGVAMADAADDNDISIFTVSLGANAAQTAYNASLVRGIGVAYDTPDSSQLASILTTIAGTIPIAIVK